MKEIELLNVYAKLDDAAKALAEAQNALKSIMPAKIYTVDTVKECFQKLLAHNKPEAMAYIPKLLNKYNAKKVSDLDPADFADVCKEAYVWMQDDIPF